MKYSQMRSQLLRGKMPGLAIWMADPVDVEVALRSLDGLQNRICAGNLDEQAVLALSLGEIITRLWAGKDIEAGYKNLLALQEGARQQSMLGWGLIDNMKQKNRQQTVMAVRLKLAATGGG